MRGYRAWHKEEKKMFDLYSVSFTNGQCGLEGFGMELWERLVIMESTGLKDKTGKEIYEGDIIKVPSHYVGYYRVKEHEMIVEWYDSDCPEGPGFYLSNRCILWKDCEVLGNIHENPELLEKNK